MSLVTSDFLFQSAYMKYIGYPEQKYFLNYMVGYILTNIWKINTVAHFHSSTNDNPCRAACGYTLQMPKILHSIIKNRLLLLK